MGVFNFYIYNLQYNLQDTGVIEWCLLLSPCINSNITERSFDVSDLGYIKKQASGNTARRLGYCMERKKSYMKMWLFYYECIEGKSMVIRWWKKMIGCILRDTMIGNARWI